MTVVEILVEEVAIVIAGIVEAEEDTADVAIDTMIVEEGHPLAAAEEEAQAVVHRPTMIGEAVAVVEEIDTMNGTMAIDRAVRSAIAAAEVARTVARDRRCRGTVVEASAVDIAGVVVLFLLLRDAMMIEWAAAAVAVVVTIAEVHLGSIIAAVAVAVQKCIGEVEVPESMATVTVICIVTGIEVIVRNENEHEQTDGVQAIGTRDLSILEALSHFKSGNY